MKLDVLANTAVIGLISIGLGQHQDAELRIERKLDKAIQKMMRAMAPTRRSGFMVRKEGRIVSGMQPREQIAFG